VRTHDGEHGVDQAVLDLGRGKRRHLTGIGLGVVEHRDRILDAAALRARPLGVVPCRQPQHR
jgi:hypothetical protein